MGSVVKAGCAPALLALACLSGPIAAQTEEPAVVRNEDHEVSVVRVELRGALHNGMVQPPSEDEAFLLVFIETSDPSFDFERNQDCFPEAGYMEDLDRVAWACGEIALGEDDVRSADGGGQLADGLACSYVVPISATTIQLTLRGYPEIDLAPAH